MRGDHVYYNCSTYTHHGIDCGDGTVIHYNKNNAQVSRISRANFASAMTVFVKEYSLHDFLDNRSSGICFRLKTRDYFLRYGSLVRKCHSR